MENSHKWSILKHFVITAMKMWIICLYNLVKTANHPLLWNKLKKYNWRMLAGSQWLAGPKLMFSLCHFVITVMKKWIICLYNFVTTSSQPLLWNKLKKDNRRMIGGWLWLSGPNLMFSYWNQTIIITVVHRFSRKFQFG